MSTQDAINKIDEMIGHMIGPFGEEPECKELRRIKKLLESDLKAKDEWIEHLRQTIGRANEAFREERHMRVIAEQALKGHNEH